jgi:hypothetical protein
MAAISCGGRHKTVLSPPRLQCNTGGVLALELIMATILGSRTTGLYRNQTVPSFTRSDALRLPH